MTEDSPVPADQCRDMQQVRRGVDTLDRALIELLAERFSYMDAAARIKQDRSAVRDEARKSQVIVNAARLAEQAGLPEGLANELWETLVEASIAYELGKWDAAKPRDQS